jgi:hypothetical protein
MSGASPRVHSSFWIRDRPLRLATVMPDETNALELWHTEVLLAGGTAHPPQEEPRLVNGSEV